MVATYALINKVLLKFHTDLLRFFFLFHGLFFFLIFFSLSPLSMLHEDELTWSVGVPRVGLVFFQDCLETI